MPFYASGTSTEGLEAGVTEAAIVINGIVFCSQ